MKKIKNLLGNFLKFFGHSSKDSSYVVDEKGFSYFFDHNLTQILRNAKGCEAGFFMVCLRKYYRKKFICYTLVEQNSGTVITEGQFPENLITYDDEIYS
jgi:hypothetical protein